MAPTRAGRLCGVSYGVVSTTSGSSDRLFCLLYQSTTEKYPLSSGTTLATVSECCEEKNAQLHIYRFVANFGISLVNQFDLYIRGAIKKFSVWFSSVQNKIKIVFASYSSKAQNTICAMWLLCYKYFICISCAFHVHFSVWTKCLSEGCWKC